MEKNNKLNDNKANDVYSIYGDIINLPHHQSKKHFQMPVYDRAAQFSPFAALTGHSDAINETGRLTDKRIELDEAERERLDEKMRCILATLDYMPEISITYFVDDMYKSGGEYVTINGKIVKVDSFEKKIVMEDGRLIAFEDIIDLEM